MESLYMRTVLDRSLTAFPDGDVDRYWQVLNVEGLSERITVWADYNLACVWVTTQMKDGAEPRVGVFANAVGDALHYEQTVYEVCVAALEIAHEDARNELEDPTWKGW
jgi:hypothetical protein